ncbi:MAG: DNA recombination protein RmuC [Actinomycetota bacterium]
MELITLFSIVLAASAIGALLFSRRGTADVEPLKRELEHLARTVSKDTALLSSRLEGIDSRLTSTQVANQDLAQNIFHTLGNLKRSTDAVAEQARGFTALQDLLRAPKARGGLGEAMLEELLRQILPPSSYAMQHRFSSGVVVDAVVKAGDRIICIDSKFPLANYQRLCEASEDRERKAAERAFAADVARHIRDIADRYIVPDEGTMEFAVMYVPAEGVYGEVLRLSSQNGPITDLAVGSRVVPMSPLTMYGYLQTILFGLKCLQIEKNAEEILGFCGRLHQEMETFASDYEVLGRHLLNARARYEDGVRHLDRVRDRLGQVTSSGDAPVPDAGSSEALPGAERPERLSAVND